MPEIDPVAWLVARGWTRHVGRAGDEFWHGPGHVDEPGWEGGWNLSGAVHMQLEAENRQLLNRMGLWEPIVRRRRRR